MRTMNKVVGSRRQYLSFAALSLAALGLTAILLPSSGAYFKRFFGGADPILVVLAAGVVGAAALGFLGQCGFEILKGRATLRGTSLSGVLATILALAIVIADLVIRYPQDTNVPMPQALLFYPSIGFVAEIVFHVAPLAVLMLVLTPFRKRVGPDRLVWFCIFFVAALEPSFQVLFEGKPLSWALVYTWIHVFAISFLQLYVFRRFDFMSMYAFRLFYYAYWHVLWGVLRLNLLF
jgi:hypothetical protein